eukprot:7875847-Lingulodinium_polyedra.AAC.1
MMWSNRLSAAMAARKSHTHALHANTCSHEVRARAIFEPMWWQTIDSTASLCAISETVHNDAVKSAARRHGGSRIAHAT